MIVDKIKKKINRRLNLIKDKKIKWEIDGKLEKILNLTKEEIKEYKEEFDRSKILEDLQKKLEDFEKNITGKTYRGVDYKSGALSAEKALYIYNILRKTKPETVVETGVCNGVSTSFFLLALHQNEKGKLYSIDFPEIADTEYEPGDFWEGKGGSVIPKGKQSGWMIPDYLRDRWELTVGKSQEKLPEVLEKLEKIDFFIHDSEHSYECMWFEFDRAYKLLSEGGILMSDDIDRNSSFQDFAKDKKRPIVYLGSKIGFFVK